jgi:hypothetical protein
MVNQRNIADPDKVREAGAKSNVARKTELADIRAVMDSAEGRRLVWRLLDHCGVFKSIWEPSAKIHYYAGIQDVGHFIMSEVIVADKNKFLQMQLESFTEGDKDDE